MLKLCNKDAGSYSFEDPSDTEPGVFSMLDSSHQPLDSSHQPHWSTELTGKQLPPQVCPLLDQMGAALEETKVFRQATNKGGSSLKECSHVQCHPIWFGRQELGPLLLQSPLTLYFGVIDN